MTNLNGARSPSSNVGVARTLALFGITGLIFALLSFFAQRRRSTTADALRAQQRNDYLDAHNCYCYNNPQEECPELLDSYSNLVNQPQYSDGQVPPCVLYERTLRKDVPVFSIILTVNIQDEIIRETVHNILQFTQEPWEFIIVFDDSRDDSINEVLAALHENECIDPQNERIDYYYNSTIHASNVGVAPCNKDLVHLLLINQQTPVFETTANNIGMRAAKGEFFLLLQDDQRPTGHGWNTELAAPARAFEDVAGVTARCAHDFFNSATRQEDKVGIDCEPEPVE